MRLLLHGETGHLTMDRVAAEAGVAKGTVYYYWDSRADLLRDLQERYIGELSAIVDRLTDSEIGRDPLNALWIFLRDTATLHYRQREALAALAREIPIEEERISVSMHRLLRRFADAVMPGADRGGESDFIASFLLGGLHATLLRLLHEPDPDLDSVIRQSFEACRRVLGAGVPADAPAPH